MVSTFINPVVNPDQPLGLNAFTETSVVRRWPTQSAAELEGIIQTVYRQVLGNAYVMESERSLIAESQFKRGELNVVEFIRRIAYSDLYRTRFFENGSRNRFIELNFKHFLGRSPQNLAEIAEHSAILDSEGYEADIDAYLDSAEYAEAFGPETVPFYRGYKTEGSTPAGFTHMFSLLRGASSSDKQITANNPARLTRSLFADQASAISSPSGATNRQGLAKDRNMDRFLQDLLSQSAPATTSTAQASQPSTQPKRSTAAPGSQDEQIEQLTAQLNEVRSLSNMGAAILRKGQRPTAPTSEAAFGSGGSFATQTADKAKQIEKLQGELMSARSLANIAESKLNKWRQRSY